MAGNRDSALSGEVHSTGLDELGFEREPRLTYAELRGGDQRVAQCLAEAHRELAASLPLDSRVRALALRCGDHWGRLAGLPHGLTKVDPAGEPTPTPRSRQTEAFVVCRPQGDKRRTAG